MSNHLTFEKASDIMSRSDNSQLTLATKKQHIKLSPKHLGQIKKGVSEQLQLGLLLYNDQLEGVPVAYRNIKAVQSMGRIVADQSSLHFDIVADFILFKPTKGCKLKGVVNKVGSMFVGCLVHECFNAWMPLTQICGVESTKLMGAELEFTVEEIFSNNKVVSLRGSFFRVIRTVSILESPAKNKTIFDDDGNVSSPIGTVETPTSSQMEPLLSSTRIEPMPEKLKLKKKHKKDKSVHSTEKEHNAIDNTSVTQSVSEEMDSGLGTEESSERKKKKHKRKKSSDFSLPIVENTAESSEVKSSLEGNDASQTKSKHKKKKSKKQDTSESVPETHHKKDSEKTDSSHRAAFENDTESSVKKLASVKTGAITDQTVQEQEHKHVDSMSEKKKKKKKRHREEDSVVSAEDSTSVAEPPSKRVKTDNPVHVSEEQGEMNHSKSKKKHKHKERKS